MPSYPVCIGSFKQQRENLSHRIERRGQRDGSVVTSTFCCCRGPGFSSQCPPGSAKPPVSPGPLAPGMHIAQHIHTFREDTHTHKIKILQIGKESLLPSSKPPNK